jgi:hypothetical protein
MGGFFGSRRDQGRPVGAVISVSKLTSGQTTGIMSTANNAR